MSTKTEVLAMIATLFPDNLSREISPQDLRDVTTAMIDIEPQEVLLAEDFDDQDPAGLDTPLQITFGPAQTGDDVSIDVNGVITLHTEGSYLSFTTMYFARTTSAGTSNFFLRTLVNGVQDGHPIGIEEADDASTAQIAFTGLRNVATVPVEFTFEAMRDSSGINNGSLSGLSSTQGWGEAPSARIRVIKLT